MTACLVLFSGGKDSTTALFWARANYDSVRAVSVIYNGRPRCEVSTARTLARDAGIDLLEPTLGFMSTGAADPRVGQRDDPRMTTRAGGYVPMRNFLLYGAAAYYCEMYGVQNIVSGHYRGEGVAYPDASPEFLRALERSFAISLGRQYVQPIATIRIVTPLADLDDKGVISLGRALGAPLEASWSCWYDGEVPCGVCFSCEDRVRAFAPKPTEVNL
jgi:7-cyano-7-deazaguanine synthase